MISCDTNILFPACDSTSRWNDAARTFVEAHAGRKDFCLCEQVLMELYCLLRNPKVCQNPLSGQEAVKVIQGFRDNPNWRIVDVVGGSEIMKTAWSKASATDFAYRRIFDVRLSATLQHHGVRSFATQNLKDFRDLGFIKLWDPLQA